MRLRHVEVFHAVYTTGSVSAAARSLNVSQPSVTKVLRHAEGLLGFALFERTRGRLVPTADAHVLYEEVGDIQDRVARLRKTTRNIRRGRGLTLRIATLPSLALGVIPEAVSAFLARQTDVRLELHTVHTDDIASKLTEREADLVIGYEAPRTAALASVALGAGEMMAVFRAADLPDAPARIGLEALRSLPFISTVESGPQGAVLLGELERLDLALDEVAASRTFFVAAALVRAGVGVTVVDSFTAAAALTPDLAARPLEPAIPFTVHAVYLENRPLSATAADFLRVLAERLRS